MAIKGSLEYKKINRQSERAFCREMFKTKTLRFDINYRCRNKLVSCARFVVHIGEKIDDQIHFIGVYQQEYLSVNDPRTIVVDFQSLSYFYHSEKRLKSHLLFFTSKRISREGNLKEENLL